MTKPDASAGGPGENRDPGKDGRLPCQSPRRAPWKYLLLGAIFLAWLAFLVYCAVAGNG